MSLMISDEYAFAARSEISRKGAKDTKKISQSSKESFARENDQIGSMILMIDEIYSNGASQIKLIHDSVADSKK